MLELIGETVIKKTIDIATAAVEKKINLSGTDVKIDTSGSKVAIATHIYMISRWASDISFRDLRGSKRLVDSFVDLDLTLGPLPTRGRAISGEKIRATDLIRYGENIVILGDPGAGKTTSLKKLALDALKTADEKKAKKPILVRLRDLGETSLVSEVLNTLGVTIHYGEDIAKDNKAKEKIQLRIAGQYLANLNALLLVDGLDETPIRTRENLVKDIRALTLHSKGYQVVVTCRVADYYYNIESTTVFAIEPLSPEQIRSFAIKWLGEEAGSDLLKKIGDTPYGGSEVRPLTLGHLCAIYERSGSIPEKPRTVYRKIVRLLLEEWDEQRSIRRESRYASFDVDRKEDFLEAIAFHLTTMSERSSFGHKELERAYLAIYERFGLPKGESRKVAREIESHTGLIVELGPDAYEFAHKSIQEYLAAEYLLRLPHIPIDLSGMLPNEMALAVALSSDSNEYFSAIIDAVNDQFSGNLENFTLPFLRRILVEKVDFRPSVSLGHSVLLLYSETYYPSYGQMRLPLGSSEDLFTTFLKQEVVYKSVNLVLSQSRLQELSENLKTVSPRENDSQLTYSYSVDDRFLSMFFHKGDRR